MVQNEYQRFIYKIHSSRIRNSKWDLTLPLKEARKNEEVIALASSQMLRWIDEIRGMSDIESKSRAIKTEIKKIKSEENSVENKKRIRKLYNELDMIQFKKDYVNIIIDKPKDYYRLCKGFKINGISYKRLIGTVGGIKNSTIVFVSDDIHEELQRRIDNGRNMGMKFTPSKLEAYKALSCSASSPVSMPNGLLVVSDCNTMFNSDIVYISDENDGEPDMKYINNSDVTIDATDGFGLMSPTLAKRWSDELDLGYLMSGCNTRCSFSKGMVYTFDFIDFADKIANKYIVKDVWGDEVDIRDVELILTESMLKLWDSYNSCAEYLSNCSYNKYTFGIAKTCPQTLESSHNLNYQFIQSYELSDEDIDELISPTVNEIKDVINGDWRKSLLFLRGTELTEKSAFKQPNDFVKGLMIDKSLINDPYVQNNIYQLIKNTIQKAKTGVIKVHGNYSMAMGDPYLLCQHIFGLEETGLLKSKEIFNRYWADSNSEYLACFRAPMSCHNNICKVKVALNDDIDYWYKYLNTCTIFSAWSNEMNAMNGMDFDGDLVMLTDNRVLVDNLKDNPTIMCVQRKASKTIPSEDDYIKSNIESFGNEIGQTTNYITSMYEVRSKYNKDTEEYNILNYRIMCGQLYQQNVIDKSKGIISKPMPKEWYDVHSVMKIDDDEKRELYKSIMADKKPYFMIYIYPALRREYNQYIKDSNYNCLREFNVTINELKEKRYSELNDREKEFLKYFDLCLPVGNGDCVMNKICRRIESEFDGYVKNNPVNNFDPSILKCDGEYTYSQYNSISKLCTSYNKKLKNYKIYANKSHINEFDNLENLIEIDNTFRTECESICPNKYSLCNIIVDLCYSKSTTKRFAWAICKNEIIDNLLNNNNYNISIPVKDIYGDIYYDGETFSLVTKNIREDELDNGNNA